MDQPSALHLAVAAAFAPLRNHEFVSTLVFTTETSIAINFSTSAPIDLGEDISQSLSEISVKQTDSGIEIDVSSLNSRVGVRAVGNKVAEILIAAGSNIAEVRESVVAGVKKFDQRDREFLDNVPPHHGV